MHSRRGAAWTEACASVQHQSTSVYPSVMGSGALRGTRVAVLGAGLAGLAAARALEADGATTIVVEARDRVGGRVHTIREGFAAGQHAEAGADLIESNQT